MLCDVSQLTPPPGAFERFEAGVELARAADPRMKLAVVARAEIVDYIFQNVARSHGASVAVFSSETAALRWLLGAKKGRRRRTNRGLSLQAPCRIPGRSFESPPIRTLSTPV